MPETSVANFGLANSMETINVNGVALRAIDQGPRQARVILFSNSLGCSLEMWDPQAEVLGRDFRVIRYDSRGHGLSALGTENYSLAALANDALAVLDHFGVERAHWCGLSLGGMIGQMIAALQPHRLDKVVLANTTSHYADQTFWKDRIARVISNGLDHIAEQILAGWLTEGFRRRNPGIAEIMQRMLVRTSVQGYIATCDAISTLDTRSLLPTIKARTLVIAGQEDRSTPVAAAHAIASAIPASTVKVLEAAHISNIEASSEFTRAVGEFLA
jgi:3-oxoadipate enol-lactonase